METYYWTTDYAHNNNEHTMQEYLDEVCMLDIITVDGTYAEGKNAKGEIYAIHASGNGDFFNHKITFELMNPKTKSHE